MNRLKLLSVNLLVGTTCFAGITFANEPNFMHDGFFLGLGANYNSIYLTQNSWGKGISNILTNTGVNSNGVAQGTGTPFNDVTNTFAPDIQLGYFKYIPCTEYLYGFKLTYQYINTIATNSNLFIPQLGQTTSTTGTTTALYGYVNANAVKVKTNHQASLLAFIGQSFGNKFVYLGIGPTYFNLRSRNIYSIGYAEVDGVTINVTGLISYSSPSVWMLGGLAQIGMTYFLSPTWFIDASYSYAITGNKTTSHQQTFTNSSSVGGVSYTTSGTLFTKDTLKIKNQTISFTINKILDF